MASLITFDTPFTGGPSFFTGSSGSSNLVPSLFPVAVNGRPYMLDLESNQFQHQFEPRVRDSSDNSTAPGESAINPQGFWRRGQRSWHFGAGQFYADDAESQDFRFYKSKGVNPWTKGQLSLLNATKVSLSSAATNLKMLVVNGHLYVADGQTLKYTTDPFASSPSWTSVTTGAPAAAINDLTTDGKQIYVSYVNEGVLMTTIGGASVTDHYATSGGTYNYTTLGFAKGFVLGFHNDTTDSHVHLVPYAASTGHGSASTTIRTPTFVCAGFAGGQNAIYVAGRDNDVGTVYRIGIKDDGTLDEAVVAFEHPIGEYPTAIHAYLGAIVLGTNKGVRYCTPDSQGNLVAGLLIPTTGDVKGFASTDRFTYFGWSNYDGTTGGVGRMDLSRFTSANTPAFATDLQYASLNAVNAVGILADKVVFTVSGVGVVVEDTANLVASGTLETGSYTWDIPDYKFVPRFDVRSPGLVGTIELATSYDRDAYVSAGSFTLANATDHTYITDQNNLIEASYRFTLNRATATTGPTLTRWMARAWASPKRSTIITLPVLLHQHLNVGGQDWFLDVEQERELLEQLVTDPRIVTYQERERTWSVIVEDVDFRPVDSSVPRFLWEGTAVITMRTVAD